MLKITDDQLVEYKRKTVGFIWQNNARNLLSYLTALENVEMPMILNGKVDRAYAKQLLEWVGLKDRMHNKLHQLSGGEQQRVAIAISLANRPVAASGGRTDGFGRLADFGHHHGYFSQAEPGAWGHHRHRHP